MNKFNRIFLMFGVFILFFLTPFTANANNAVQSQLNKTFAQMSNVSNPAIFSNQRRGVISGGGVAVRNKIIQANLVSYVPPSFSAGCGGIDLFGGSFSFINKQEFENLLRSIAANAAGYIFHIALETVCGTCLTILDTLQKKIQELNQHFGNSCQLAQGIVNDAFSSRDWKGKTDVSLKEMFTGGSSDFFASFTGVANEDSERKLKSRNPQAYKDITGNMVYDILQYHHFPAWFTLLNSSSESIMEMALSFSGSIVVGDPPSNPKKKAPVTEIPGAIIDLNILVNGGELQSYKCAGQDCRLLAANSIVTNRINGLKKMIEDVLLGTNPPNIGGVVNKFYTGSGALAVGSNEEKLMISLPSHFGSMVRTLAVISPEIAQEFIRNSSGALSTHIIYDMINQIQRAIDKAINSAPTDKTASAYLTQLKRIVSDSKKEYARQYKVLEAEQGKLADIFNRYQERINVVNNQISKF